MQSLYERLFVAFYGWSLKVDGRAGPYHAYYASLSLSLGIILNLASLLMALELISGWRVVPSAGQVSKLWVALTSLAIVAVNFLYFRKGQRYKKLVRTYAGSDELLAAMPSRALIAYMVLSFLLVVGLLIMRLKFSCTENCGT
jgi:hypothetical protein